jgi:5-methylthioribose kinase
VTKPNNAQPMDQRIVEFLNDAHLVDGAYEAEPLTGGVASDIWKVQSGDRVFAVKMALSRLRVAQEWNAPVSRNASEVEWLKAAAKVVPRAVPQILAHDPERGVFAMSFLDPKDHPTWKSELRQGRANPDFAAQLGRAVRAIHSATAGAPEIARRFDNDGVFKSIRLEPYFDATAGVHADLADRILELSSRVLTTKQALVHGDVSPKNILVGPGGPVILDAECAWYGDPAFDVAFCLNHLLLKCIWVPERTADFLACFEAVSSAYLEGVDWDAPKNLESRVAQLLPALVLARIDGKSPVEYITTDTDKANVRRVGRAMLKAGASSLADIRSQWTKEFSP